MSFSLVWMYCRSIFVVLLKSATIRKAAYHVFVCAVELFDGAVEVIEIVLLFIFYAEVINNKDEGDVTCFVTK